MRVSLFCVSLIAFSSSGLQSAAAQRPGVITIRVEPPTVTRVEFDRRRPPPDMPSTSVDGSGVCDNLFVLDSGVAASIEELSPTSVRAYPEDFDIITRLDITIYTAEGAPPQLHAHEEGHRMIGEYYYRSAEAAARAAIQTVVGRAFEGSGATREAAEQAALAKVHAELDAAYTARMQARSSAANARYDSITANGLRSTITEADAIAMAIAADP